MSEIRPRTILIVDDDDAFSYAISRHLESNGYNVVVASGSMAALRKLDIGVFDLVVIDVALQPEEPHGVSLALMIGRNHPGTSVLFVTGRRDLIEIVGSLPGDVLYKPIELDELTLKAGEILNKPHSKP
jgi:DNA-binding response OmpR family regulator